MEQERISEEHLDELNKAMAAQRKAVAALQVVHYDIRNAYKIKEGDVIDEFSGRILRAPTKDPAA